MRLSSARLIKSVYSIDEFEDVTLKNMFVQFTHTRALIILKFLNFQREHIQHDSKKRQILHSNVNPTSISRDSELAALIFIKKYIHISIYEHFRLLFSFEP